MGKVFRIFKEGANTYNDWNSSPDYPYDSTNRESIIDPEGATASKEITSIPSPFARIDLVKNAFGYICRQNNDRSNYLDGNTIFHKMVSETLDVGEIFFNYHKLQDKLEIIRWNPAQNIQELLNSGNEGNECLGDVLTKYLQSDSSTYNFEAMQSMYLLNFRQGPQMLNIIGATSPATVFFSSANDLSYVAEHLTFGQHNPFGKEYQPLYKRDAEYIKAWFAFRKSVTGFSNLFPEIDEYLSQNFAAIQDTALKSEILDMQGDDEKFEYINASRDGIDHVEVIGHKILALKPHEFSHSDFEIVPTRVTSGKPLVLPADAGNVYDKLVYTSSQWGSFNAAPLNDSRKLEERTLPYDGMRQAYITLGDLLEDNIIAVPHVLNHKGYFNGNVAGDSSVIQETSFLLPLKPLYFRYFSPENLMGTMPDGKNAIEMLVARTGEVKVTLRIPIRGNASVKYIEYCRTYKPAGNADADPKCGVIHPADFTAFLTPCVKFPNCEDAYYTAAVVTTDNKPLALDFYSNDERLADIISDSRTSKEDLTKATTYTLEQKRFEYVKLKAGNGVENLIVPIFRENNGVISFEFSVDLGTSYTHMEYKINGKGESVPFEYSENDALLSELFLPKYVEKGGKLTQWDLLDEQPFIDKDFLPQLLGKGKKDIRGNVSDLGFPTQTVLSCARSTVWNKRINAFSLVNIPFTFGKRRDLPHNKYEFNIKWGDERDRNILDKYIECLMLMMRNKVLLNHGSLASTKIVWFYPQSMSQNQLNSMRRIWNNKYNKYFSPAPAKTTGVLESIAPIRYYFSKISSSSDIVNIDIGGGTTDIAFAKQKDVQCVTSFKFAIYDIFRDAIATENSANGIIDYFKPQLRKILEQNDLAELVAVFDSEGNKRPENMASFLFSLKDNQMARRVDHNLIDFDYILENDTNFKVVFYLFYTAIIYHVAQIIKNRSLEFPRHIAVSGNGGYVLNILSSDNQCISNYTKTILESVVGKQCSHDIDIVGLEDGSNPKVVTCKGGLVGSEIVASNKPEEIILKAAGNGFVDRNDSYAKVTENIVDEAVKAVENYLDFALNIIPQKVDILDSFGISADSLRTARNICGKDLKTYLCKMLSQTIGDDPERKIEETLFFYPIKGMLCALAGKIYEQLSSK